MANSFGVQFVVTSFGESHGRCVGVVIDGCPAGLLAYSLVLAFLSARARRTDALLGTDCGPDIGVDDPAHLLPVAVG